MGLLLYNVAPRQQYFFNGSFELPLNTGETNKNWYIEDDVVRQQDVVAFGSWATRIGQGGNLIQRGPHLLTSGRVTVSILSRGTPGLFCMFNLLTPQETLAYSETREFAVTSDSDFNIAYAVFNVPTVANTEAEIIFFNSGTGDIYVDNAKMEQGKSPSRFSTSSFPEDPAVVVPTTFLQNPTVDDPNDPVLPAINLRRATNATALNQPIVPPGTLQDGSSAGDGTVIGGDPSSAYEEYKQFVQDVRDILRDDREEVINRKESRFFPKTKDEEFLKFTRDELKKKIDDYAKIGSVQRMGLLYAKNKMASFRRAFETRMHSRLDHYTFGFMDKRLDDKYLRQEDGAIREVSGAG